jgi:uncharacterized phage protein (TIGR01671 family)
MREIEFRAWDKEGKEMFRVVSIAFLPNGKRIYSGRGGSVGSDEAVLMQYTGLKDKNGKKIFEEDIVKIVTGGRRGEVFIVSWHQRNNEFADFRLYSLLEKGVFPYGIGAGSFLKVIGNIYEHYEILEK